MIFSSCMCDATPSRDPSGTASLQADFWHQAEIRWQRVESTVRKALSEKGIMTSLLAHSDKLTAFQTWLDQEMALYVMGGTGDWVRGYIQQASSWGLGAAGRALGNQAAQGNPEGLRTLQAIAVAELQGIVDATSQQVTRVVGLALLAGKPVLPAALDRLRSVGMARTQMFISWAVIKTVASETLAAYRNAGMSHVGTVSETLPKVVVGDAARKTPQKRHGKTGRFLKFTPPPSKRKLRAIFSTERKLQKFAAESGGSVDVETAEDDQVCPVCDQISLNGPYPIEEAESLIPAHPNCRCIFVPAGSLENDDV